MWRPVLQAVGLRHAYRVRGRLAFSQEAVDVLGPVSFDLLEREVLGIVGESGSGKTTLARTMMCVPRPRSGSVLLEGTDLTTLHGAVLRHHRRTLQMVFQNPFASMDSSWRVSSIVAEPMVGFGIGTRSQRRNMVAESLERVGLSPAQFADRMPRELSGGQCQRVAIARALASRPRILVLDEALCALDVLTQAQILALLMELQVAHRLSYLFISHDLAVVGRICHRVGVMFGGSLCELGPTPSVYAKPHHPYSRTLLAAHRESDSLEHMSLGDAAARPFGRAKGSGCVYRAQCPRAQYLCQIEAPAMRQVAPAHVVACHFPL